MNEKVMIQELSKNEKETINGGGAITTLLVGIATTVIVEYWSDIKQAASDAWNGE